MARALRSNAELGTRNAEDPKGTSWAIKRYAAILLALGCGLLAPACKKTEAENLAEKNRQFQEQQRKRAIENYQQIIRKYPESEYAAKAQERLRALNAGERPAEAK